MAPETPEHQQQQQWPEVPWHETTFFARSVFICLYVSLSSHGMARRRCETEVGHVMLSGMMGGLMA